MSSGTPLRLEFPGQSTREDREAQSALERGRASPSCQLSPDQHVCAGKPPEARDRTARKRQAAQLPKLTARVEKPWNNGNSQNIQKGTAPLVGSISLELRDAWLSPNKA